MLVSNEKFCSRICRGIENSKAFVVFLSRYSANSEFVLNEIHHAVECKNENDNYKILPVIIDSENQDLASPVYKKINFYLARYNMLFSNQFYDLDNFTLKILEQIDFEIKTDELHDSLYHSSEAETKRLKAQNEILKEFSREFFEKYINEDFRILDVGCANGDNIMLRLEGIEYKSLLGVDIEEGQIKKANDNYGFEKNKFVNCDILSDDFDDMLRDYLEDVDSLGFDLIHISAVVLHLKEPVKLFKTLRRFLKKDGYLFIQDEDDGANLVHPYSKFFEKAFTIWADSMESGDRTCARKIPEYLREANFSRISLAKCGVTNLGLDAETSEAFWDIYFNHYLWLAAEENIFYHLAETNKLLDEYKKEYEDYKQQYDEGKIFIQYGFLFFIVRR